LPSQCMTSSQLDVTVHVVTIETSSWYTSRVFAHCPSDVAVKVPLMGLSHDAAWLSAAVARLNVAAAAKAVSAAAARGRNMAFSLSSSGSWAAILIPAGRCPPMYAGALWRRGRAARRPDRQAPCIYQ